MKNLLPFLLCFLTIYGFAQTKNFYDFSATTIDGKMFDFATLKGKKVMIVNTATECALAPQLKKMQELYEEYGGEDFEIIAFPCNDFGNREPANDSTISAFFKIRYNITFPIMSKISIKGENEHPLYKWLTNSSENGKLDAKVTWNFQKFLIDENGQVADFIPPMQGPKNRRIIEWLME
jgi:glutathione peroxidase